MNKPQIPDSQQSNDVLQDWANLKDVILRLLPPMGALAAVSLAGVSLFHLHSKLHPENTLVDETLALCAVLFLLCYPTTIWAARTTRMTLSFFLGRLTLAMFLVGVALLIYSVCRMFIAFSQ